MEENNEKLQKVLDYFEEIGVEIPTPVKNSIEDVFDENDQIDTVDLYMKEDAETFLDEASFKDMVIVDLSGKSTGSRHNTYTYYGDVLYDENLVVSLNKGEEVVELIDDIKSPFSTDEKECNISRFDDTDWVILLLEHITWEAPCESESRENILVIYCPERGDADENDR
jgi:hypothetical protein